MKNYTKLLAHSRNCVHTHTHERTFLMFRCHLWILSSFSCRPHVFRFYVSCSYIFFSLDVLASFWLTLYLKENECYLSWFGISRSPSRMCECVCICGANTLMNVFPFHCVILYVRVSLLGCLKIKAIKNRAFDPISKSKIKEMKIHIE